MLTNIRSILGQGGKSKVKFLSDLAIQHKACAVAVTESWLKPEIYDSELTVNFPGYSLFRSDRKVRAGGGVCVFLREDITGECLVSYNNGVCSLLLIKLHLMDVIMAVVYRPPDTRISEFTPVLTEIENCLSKLSTPVPTVLMLGDLNLPSSVMSWIPIEGQVVPHVLNHRVTEEVNGLQTRLQAKKLCELCTNFQMTQLVDKPTHEKEILDLVFTSNPNTILNVDMDYFPVFSDHKVLSINLICGTSEYKTKT